MKNKETIRSILISLLDSGITHKIKCIFSDGMGNNVFYICLSQSGKTVGEVSFKGDDGKLCRYYYKDLKFNADKSIIDLLFEIYNLETELVI